MASREDLVSQLAFERGLLTPVQLSEALSSKRSGGEGMLDVLVAKGYLTREQVDDLSREVAGDAPPAPVSSAPQASASDAAPPATALPSIVPPSHESDRAAKPAAKPTIEPPASKAAQPDAPTDGPAEMRILAGFEVLGKIGSGAMGSVYRAKKIETGDVVALKVLPPSAATRSLIARFKRESEIVKGLDHPNIVKCHEFGYDAEKDCHFCALELVEGENLRDLIGRLGTVPEQEVVVIARQLAQALNYAFGAGLIHRDVKPANVMISRGGIVKLLDLGLARPVDVEGPGVTMAGTFVGSPYYSSPEQAKADSNIDFRSDIYSLGATIYHMVAGHPPFEGANVTEVLIKQLDSQLDWPEGKDAELSRRLGLVAAKMMAKDRADRYQTPTEMSLDLDIIGQGTDPVIASGNPVLSTIALPGWPTVGKGKRPRRAAKAEAHGDRKRKPTTRHDTVRGAHSDGESGGASGARWGLIAAGVAVLALVGVLAFVFSRSPKTPPTAEPVAAPEPGVPATAARAADDADDAEKRERVARQHFAYAKRYAEKNPDDFAIVAAKFREALESGKGTALELEADAALVELDERWQAAAEVALAAAKEKANALAETADYDGAVAVLEGIPKDLASKVTEDAVAAATALHRAAGAKIDAAVAEAAALFAAGDTRGTRTRLKSIEDVRFKQGQDAVAPRVMSLLMKAEAADGAAARAEVDKENARLAALLGEFEALVEEGQFSRAAERMAALSRKPENKEAVDVLRGASRVATELGNRRDAILTSARSRIGRPISIKTSKRVFRGTLKEVTEAALVVVSQNIINGRVQSEIPHEVSWADVPAALREEFVSDWEPDGDDGEIAKVYVALGRDDAEAAATALASAGDHPLAKHLALKLAPPAPEPAAGAGAGVAWPPTLAQVAKLFHGKVKAFDPATLTVTLLYDFASPDEAKDWTLGEFGRKPSDRMGVNNGRFFLRGGRVWALATGVFTRVALKADLSLHGENPATVALAACADGRGNAYNFYPVQSSRNHMMAKWIAGKPERLSAKAPSPFAGRRRGLVGFAYGNGTLMGWIGKSAVANTKDANLASGRVGVYVSESVASFDDITIKGSLDEKWLRSKLGGAGARPANIPADAAQFGGHFYKFYERAEPVSWHQAKALCEEKGGHLITISSTEEQRFAVDLALLRKMKGTWIGLTEEGHPDDWRWVTGEPFTYKSWAAGEPNNWDGTAERWAALYPTEWCDVRVKNSQIASLICEWEPPAARPANVPADAAEFGGHWYKMYPGRTTVGEATAAAKRLGGYLACITSAAENDFVAKIAKLPKRRVVLLGGSDVKEEGRWRWVSGEPFVFKSWHPDEPEGGRKQNYLGVWADGTGKWVDVQRDHPLITGYVCEWGPARTKTGAPDAAAPADPRTPRKTGLLGTYFNGKDLETPVVRRVDAQLVIDFGEASPFPDRLDKDFSVRWEGTITPPRTGSYTFQTVSDDGVRVWVGEKLLIDRWKPGVQTDQSKPVSLAGGRALPIKIEYSDVMANAHIRLSWSGPGFEDAPVAEKYLAPPKGYEKAPGPPIYGVALASKAAAAAVPLPRVVKAHGLMGYYYLGAKYEKLVARRLAGKMDFSKTGLEWPEEVRKKKSSARWEGYFAPPKTGEYRFSGRSDDGSRMSVAGIPVFEKWSPGTKTGEPIEPVLLERGKMYPVRVEYFDVGGHATITVYCSGPGIEKQVVPSEWLIPAKAKPGALAAPAGGKTSGDWKVQTWGNPATVALSKAGRSDVLTVNVPAGGKHEKAAVGTTSPPSLAGKRVVHVSAQSLGKAKVRVALAFTTADGYFETLPASLPPGRKTRITVDLKARDFKTKATRWRAESAITGTERTSNMYLVVYSEKQAAKILFSDLRAE